MPKNTRKLKCSKRFTALTKRIAAFEIKKANVKAQLVLRKFGDEFTSKESTYSYSSFQMTSEYLSKFYVQNKMLFRLHGSVNEANFAEFYTNNLLEVSTAKCGCLLKDLRTIPGRDATPERENSKLSSSDEECYLNEKEDGIITSSEENIEENNQEEYGTGLDDRISIASKSADVVLLNPLTIAESVTSIISKSVSENHLNFRGSSPDIFAVSDEEQPMGKTVLAAETPPQSIESNYSIEIASSSETVTTNTSILKAFDSMTIPSSSETLTSIQQDDEMSDISEELPPQSQFRTKQDEEEERILDLYTKGLVDNEVDAEVDNFSEPQTPKSPVPQTFGALEVSVIVSSKDLEENTPDCNEEAIRMSGSFIKETETGVMVFENFTIDDGEIYNTFFCRIIILNGGKLNIP